MQNAQLCPANTGDGTTQIIACTLIPLWDQGRDSLSVDDNDPIKQAQLDRVDLQWENSRHQVTTQRADDLFHTPAPYKKSVRLVPKGAEPVSARFTYELKTTAEPHWVEMAPPNKVTYQHPEDANIIASFFARHGYLVLQRLASIIVIALALLSGAIPDLDDDDDDDGLDDTHHSHAQLNKP